jgi:nucleotide-binding universal stress UspA family protein
MSIQYKRLLVTLDGSDLASQVMPHARHLAATFGAELILFRVVHEVQPEADYTFLANRYIHAPYRHMTADSPEEPKQRYLVREAERSLTLLSQELEREGIKSNIVIQIGDNPAEKILEYASSHAVDLILMSTHGRTGLAHLVYGSVAEAVLHRVPCPILLFRPAI